MYDFRLWIPFSFNFQKHVLTKFIQSMCETKMFMGMLSDILCLYYQPEFPSDLKLYSEIIVAFDVVISRNNVKLVPFDMVYEKEVE